MLLGRYTLDAERFDNHPELTTADARQRAAMQLTYQPTPRLALTADGDFLKTQTPSELNALTGLALTRASARRVAAHSSITRRLDRLTAATIDYRFSNDHIADGPEIRSHAATIGADRHRSQRDAVRINYRIHQFLFGTSSTMSHALDLGWTRAITPRASVAIDGGPRVTGGSLAPDLSASIAYQFSAGNVSLAYARTQTTVIGLAGIADAQSLNVTAAWRPWPSLQLRLSPAVVRSANPAQHADVYQLTANVERRIAKGLSLDVVLNAYLQHGNLYTAQANETIPRQNVMIRLVAAPATTPR
jgi:hypothetical protein